MSGVLTFALAAGCPVVSTPFRYAEALLADGAGRTAASDDVDGFAAAIASMLDGPLAASARRAARTASSAMRWPRVGADLRRTLEIVRLDASSASRRRPSWSRLRALGPTSTPLALTHLRLLCDDTAMLQHAHHGVARIEDGYCVDDAARMLPIADTLAQSPGGEEWSVVARAVARVRPGRIASTATVGCATSWRGTDAGSTNPTAATTSAGRSGVWVRSSPPTAPTRRSGAELLRPLARRVEPDWPTRSLAYAALGLVAASLVDASWEPLLDPVLHAARTWQPSGDPPLALVRAGAALRQRPTARGAHPTRRAHRRRRLVDRGASLLEWLERLCRQGDHYRFPGHRGMAAGDELNWSGDEQPLEAAAMADAQAAWLSASPATPPHSPRSSARGRGSTARIGSARS